MIISSVSGFCGGVERAVAFAISAAKQCRGKTYIDGALVHNWRVMDSLKSAGVKLLGEDDLEHATPLDCIVIRAHGISKARRAQLEYHFKSVIDGTCPHIAKITQMVERAANGNRPVLIIGNRSHPEVLALASAAAIGKCFAVNSMEEIHSLPRDLSEILVISQSTIGEEFFASLAGEIAKIFPGAEIQNTICGSSIGRQRAIVGLQKSGAQAIVVVGGRHSNNTATLVAAAKATTLPVFPVETVSDLFHLPLKKFSAMGVASGASTDGASIAEVVSYLAQLK
ncbi:MAG: 4-hydroxy-3-methylbut-2-enyl diphosphate reductase [Puniceicoccales bacterium]|nr:4-hydroxy-3-methylbut-2-enyl diphosphate reductase [Puniceicoccales bacterium]